MTPSREQHGESRPSRRLRDYRAYGLWVRSPIALPFAPFPSPPAGEPDVTVRIGAVPETLPASAITRRGGREDRSISWEAASAVFLMKMRGVARFLVTGGRDVLVEPRGGDDHQVGGFLTGPIFAALLRQRDVVTLHAGAIETGVGAMLFMGAKRRGKSSLIAALVERGYAMLADDVTGVALDAGGRPMALPAFPAMKLWADTLDELRWQGRKRKKVREDEEKYLVPTERFRAAPLAVGAVCVLEVRARGEGIEVETAPTADAFRWLWKHTYFKRSHHWLGRRSVYLRTIDTVVTHVPVVRVTRPAHPFRLDALADRIEELLRPRRRATVPPSSPAVSGA